LKNLVNNQLIA